MKNKILFFSVVLGLLALVASQQVMVWSGSNAEAAEGTKPSVLDPLCRDRNGARIVTYALKGPEIPEENQPMTFDELSKLAEIPGSYSWMGQLVEVPVISLKTMRERSITKSTDEFGVQANSLLHEAKALALVVKGESAQLRGELVKETQRVLGEVDKVLCGLIGETIDSTIAEGKSFSAMQSQIEVHEGCIAASRPFTGITVKGKLNPLEQSFDLIHNGAPVKFKFVVAVGDLNDHQSESVMKIYALTYSTGTNNFSIIGCADVESQPLDKDGFRVIPLTVMASKIRAEKVREILSGMPYQLQDWQVNELFAPNKTTSATQSGTSPEGVSQASTQTSGGGKAQ